MEGEEFSEISISHWVTALRLKQFEIINIYTYI